MRKRSVVAMGAVALVAVALVGIGVVLTNTAPTESSQAIPSNTATAIVPSASAVPPVAPSAAPPMTDPPASATPAPETPQQPLSEAGSNSPESPELPAPTALPRILPDAPPDAGSATGELAVDFPSKLPPAPQSTIAHSAVVSEGTRVQATLIATSELSADAVLDYYREQFAQYGLYDSPSPAVGGSTSVTFSRDDDAVTVTVTPSDAGAEYALFGTLTARG